MTKILTTFFSVLLVGLSPLFSADERARKKEEVRQELLSIQAALDEMKDGSPEIRFPPEREPEPELPPVPEVKAVEPPAGASKVEQVESELQAVQAGLDQLNRESERFSSGLGVFSKPPEPIPAPEPEVKAVEPPEGASKVEQVESELQAVQAGLDQLNRESERFSSGLGVFSKPPEPIPAPEPILPSTPQSPVLSEPVPFHKPTGGPGVYIVPSIALVHSSGFDFKFGSGFEIEEDLGGGASLRAGWAGETFFTDLQFTYARSDLESIDLGGAPLTFSGDTEFFGFHLTGGGKVGLRDKLKLPFGFGVGGGRQEISMIVGGVPFSESDFVLTYHLFAGIEYFATEHLLFGMRYRLVNLGEMTSFSNRALQMLEFSCGYQY